MDFKAAILSQWYKFMYKFVAEYHCKISMTLSNCKRLRLCCFEKCYRPLRIYFSHYSLQQQNILFFDIININI